MTRSRAAALLGWLLLVAVAATLAAGAASGTAAKPKPKAKPKPLCLGKRATIVGTARANDISGTGRADVIVGLAGNDTINGAGGNDLICAGSGNDVVLGGGGTDRVDGGPGSDTCRGAERLASCEETRPTPAQGPLTVGEYTNDVFRPKFTFAIDKTGWFLRFGDRLATHLLFARRADPRGLLLAFDSFSGDESLDATIARVTAIPGTLRVSGPITEPVGGMPAKWVEIRVTGSDLVNLPGVTGQYELEPDDRVRAYAVDVRGRTVTILIEAQQNEFATHLQDSLAIVNSVRFS